MNNFKVGDIVKFIGGNKLTPHWLIGQTGKIVAIAKRDVIPYDITFCHEKVGPVLWSFSGNEFKLHNSSKIKQKLNVI